MFQAHTTSTSTPQNCERIKNDRRVVPSIATVGDGVSSTNARHIKHHEGCDNRETLQIKIATCWHRVLFLTSVPSRRLRSKHGVLHSCSVVHRSLILDSNDLRFRQRHCKNFGFLVFEHVYVDHKYIERGGQSSVLAPVGLSKAHSME